MGDHGSGSRYPESHMKKETQQEGGVTTAGDHPVPIYQTRLGCACRFYRGRADHRWAGAGARPVFSRPGEVPGVGERADRLGGQGPCLL